MPTALLLLTALASAYEAGDKIINGEDAAYEDYPQAGAVLLDMGGFKGLICSSTLIAPDVVMTAAHCLDPEVLQQTAGVRIDDETEYRWSPEADLRAYTTGASGWPEDSYAVAQRVYHEDWSYRQLGIGLSLNYDIGLMFLEEPVTDGPYAYLPTAEEAEQLQEGSEVIVVGWGYQDPQGRKLGTKQFGISPVGPIADYEFQVGPDTDDVRKCHGDSGGPSLLEIETETVETLRVVGITSHSYDTTDCDNTGGVDTRADYYLDWIDEQMRSRCEDGSRAWCEEPGILVAPLPEVQGDTGIWLLPADLRSDIELRSCAAAPGPGGLGAWLLALLALGRRRRSAGGAPDA